MNSPVHHSLLPAFCLDPLAAHTGLSICGPVSLAAKTLIFDEADQLLDMGFRPDVEKILAALQPSASMRQTLLFSATLPKDVLRIAEFATRSAQLIDTVGEDEQQTNEHVTQHLTVTSLDAQAAELLKLIRTLTMPADHKVH